MRTCNFRLSLSDQYFHDDARTTLKFSICTLLVDWNRKLEYLTYNIVSQADS